MQVDLLEQFKPSLVDHIDFIVNLLVISYLPVDDARVADDAVVVDLRLVDLGVNQVSIQVVKLVKIE